MAGDDAAREVEAVLKSRADAGMVGSRQEKRLMVYAAYADERDQLDLVIHRATEDAGGDMRAAILELVRRQHRAESAIEFHAPAVKPPRGRRCA